MAKKPMDDAFQSGCSVGYHEGFLDGKNVGIDRGMTDMVLFFEQQVGAMFLMDAIGDEDSINYAGHVLRRLHGHMMEKIAPGNRFDGQDD